MAPDDPDDKVRHYGEAEVGRLLKIATDLLKKRDEAGRQRAPESGSMTLATLQEVAAEAGIEPRYIKVVTRNGETRIQANQRLHFLAGTLFGFVVAGLGITIGTFGLAYGMEKMGSVLFATLFPPASSAPCI